MLASLDQFELFLVFVFWWTRRGGPVITTGRQRRGYRVTYFVTLPPPWLTPQIPPNASGISWIGPRSLRAGDLDVMVLMLLSWVSRGQISTPARRDTKYIILQSLRVELAAAVFGPGTRPDGNNRASWSEECVWVHGSVFAGAMRGRQLRCRSRDTTPHSSGVHRLTSLCWELYLCVWCWRGVGAQSPVCWSYECESASTSVREWVVFCLPRIENSTYLTFCLDFG